MFFSCTPDSYDLGSVDISPDELVEGIAYTVEHDKENPNIIYLTSLLGNKYTPLWEHPQGRSQEQKVTLKMPFDGTYEVTFGVETRGGIVFGEPTTFTIDEFYPDFVSDDLWTYLTGGVGNSKTWIFDNGKYGLASGELSFQNPEDGTPTMTNVAPNWEPGAGYTGDGAIWNSYMTFSLDGGAFVEVHNEGWKDESGTFMLNVEDGTLSFVDAALAHPQGFDHRSSNWRNKLNVVVLTEKQLRVAVYRDTDPDESEWWYIWNFVSKEYADNYEQEEVDPDYNGNANDDLTTSVSTTKTWIVNPDAPYNWADLTGTLLNEWIIGDNGIPTFTDWGPPYEEEPLSNVSIKLSKTGDHTGTYEIVNYEGEEFTGDYTIDEKNWIDFGQDIDILQVDWFSFSTENGKLRLIRVDRTISGNVSVLYLGRHNGDNMNEYMTIGLVQGEGSGGEEPRFVGREISFDNDKLVYGLDDDNNFRITLYNGYGGPTQTDPGLDINEVAFDNVIQITFTLSGISFVDARKVPYTAYICIADPEWDYSYWGGDSGDVQVNGNGTYTTWC